jgi:hypothetical protein
MRNRYGEGAIFALALALVLSSWHSKAQAGTIEFLEWQPVPDSTLPEINYTAAGLQTGAGAVGNGDGNLAPAQQTPGGLEVDTILTAPVPFSFPSSLFTGGTGYYDATLTFTGLAPVGNATQTTLAPHVVQDSQVLGSGTFTFTSTAPAGSVVLLTGNIAGATIVTGVDGSMTGATFNAAGITYTGGVVFAAFPANWIAAGNDMSISMTAITPALSINGGTLQLNAFTANANGQFDVAVPEPASVGVLAVVGSALLARRRRSSL